MEFGCSVCEYTSQKKSNVIRHINKKKTCGLGIKEIIEIPIDIKCEFCNKTFSTKQNLNDHIKKTCHQKIKMLENKIKELEKRPSRDERMVQINNITQHFNIQINNYDNTKLDKLTDKTINKIITDAEEAYKIIPNLIKNVHFNPKNPENHNVYISNRTINNRYLQVFRDGQWETTNKNVEIDNIISDKETQLGDWISEKGQRYPQAKERYEEYLEQKYEPDTVKLIKEEVELILYNGRYMIKN